MLMSIEEDEHIHYYSRLSYLREGPSVYSRAVGWGVTDTSDFFLRLGPEEQDELGHTWWLIMTRAGTICWWNQ
jgi:hypothetical protein